MKRFQSRIVVALWLGVLISCGGAVYAADKPLNGTSLTGPAALATSVPNATASATVTVAGTVPEGEELIVPPPGQTIEGQGFTFTWPGAGEEGLTVQKHNSANNQWSTLTQHDVAITPGEIDMDGSRQEATLSASFAKPGRYRIQVIVAARWWSGTGDAYIGASNLLTVGMDVVSVQKLQYRIGNGAYADVPNPFYMPRGASVTLKAIPEPETTWPGGQPVWSTPAGQIGIGGEITFSSEKLGNQSVTATFGNSLKSADITVFDFYPVLTPVDNFEGRSKEEFGIGEEIDLSSFIAITESDSGSGGSSYAASFSSTQRTRFASSAITPKLLLVALPATPSASDIGGLRWFLSNGSGTLSDYGMGEGTGFYAADDSVGAFTLGLEIESGPFAGFVRVADKKTIAPTGVTFTKIPPGTTNNLYHRNGTLSSGFQALAKLTPSNVSFSKLKVYEGSCPSVVNGRLATKKDNAGTWLTELQHPDYSNNPSNVNQFPPQTMKDFGLSEKSGGAPWVQRFDDITMGDFTEPVWGSWQWGDFTWNIPWYYLFPGKAAVKFATVKHYFQTAATTGKSDMSKGNAGPYSRIPSDPDSNLQF